MVVDGLPRWGFEVEGGECPVAGAEAYLGERGIRRADEEYGVDLEVGDVVEVAVGCWSRYAVDDVVGGWVVDGGGVFFKEDEVGVVSGCFVWDE